MFVWFFCRFSCYFRQTSRLPCPGIYSVLDRQDACQTCMTESKDRLTLAPKPGAFAQLIGKLDSFDNKFLLGFGRKMPEID